MVTTTTTSSSASSSSSSSNKYFETTNCKPRPNNGPLFDTCLNELPIQAINEETNINSDQQYYRNEIYRNSHLIMTKQNLYQYANTSTTAAANNVQQYQNIHTYEAKPIQINNIIANSIIRKSSNTDGQQQQPQQQISCV